MPYKKYSLYEEEVSYDNGRTWASTGNYTASGNPIGTYETYDECTGSTSPSGNDLNYLTFVAIEEGTISWSGVEYPAYELISGYLPNIYNELSYSIDNGNTWSTPSNEFTTPIIPIGNKVLFKGSCNTQGKMGDAWEGSGGIGSFSTSSKFNLEGNIMSLIYSDNFVGKTKFPERIGGWTPNPIRHEIITGGAIFMLLFGAESTASYSCKIVDARNLVLPVTELTPHCYRKMFSAQQTLVYPPAILPATTLAPHAILSYSDMFAFCSNLVVSPILPATTPGYRTYEDMFRSCKSLSAITCLLTSTSDMCTSHWISDSYYEGTGVAENGTFYKNPEMNNWGTGMDGIPSGWTVVDYTG